MHNIINYLLAAKFPNIVTLFWIIILSFYYNIYVVVIISLIFILLSQLDAISRYREYLRINNLFKIYGWDEKIANSKIYSRCQRDAIQLAAIRNEFTKEIKQFFYNKGYRWYHIIPDKILKNPLFLFTKQFWKTFFVRKK